MITLLLSLPNWKRWTETRRVLLWHPESPGGALWVEPRRLRRMQLLAFGWCDEAGTPTRFATLAEVVRMRERDRPPRPVPPR